MKTRAKVEVKEVTVNQWNDIVKFEAVYGGTTNKEDNTFAEATPSATFSMTVNNPAVRGQFKPGQKFYVDFTPAE